MSVPALIIVAVAIVIAVSAIVCLAVRLARVTSEKSALQSRLEVQQEAYKAINDEREKVFEGQRKQMEESFRLLSEQNSAGLRRQSAESITELLKPVQERFEQFDRTIRETQVKDGERASSIQTLIKEMMERSQAVGNEAKNLADALTGHSKIQGDFGEMLLVDLLRNSGLEEGVHFHTQSVLRDNQGHEIRNENGGTMIPDVIVNYPDGSQVIIDSKVSLTAFVNYCNAESVEDRLRYAREHVESIRRHVDELKIKDYASYISPDRRKVDYNIMFIPMENAYRLMLDESPTLWQMAKDAKVLIVSQQNLMIVLNMILVSWRQHDQQKNIDEVYRTAAELMSQLKGWMESFVSVGEHLDKARDAYGESRKKLVESNQSVMKKIDKLERLKIAPKRSNARIKPGARMVGGQESIIPSELVPEQDSTE